VILAAQLFVNVCNLATSSRWRLEVAVYQEQRPPLLHVTQPLVASLVVPVDFHKWLLSRLVQSLKGCLKEHRREDDHLSDNE